MLPTYDSDSFDGKDQPDTIEVSRAEWERVQAQLAQAREAVEAVEWVYDDVSKYCPWCRAMTHYANRPIKHKRYCKRQAALAALEVKP